MGTRNVTTELFAAARRHWLFLVFLAAGTALRIVTLFAYRPAIFGPDTYWYLEHSRDLEPTGVRPFGYSVVLRVLPIEHGLALVPLLQHLLGLAVATLLYALLVRLDVGRWLAALAVAPVLLDAYQLNIEQQILSETLTEILLVAGCVLVLWRRPLAPSFAGLAGLLFAAAVLTRTIAAVVVLPALVVALVEPPRLRRTAALLAAFVVPVLLYATWFHSDFGRFSLTTYDGRFLYGRVLSFADCGEFDPPKRERVLCPDTPHNRSLTLPELLWSHRTSIDLVDPPAGESANDVAGSFARRAIRHQPGDYLRTAGSDFLRAFAVRKRGRPGLFSVRQWQFQRTFPVYLLGSLCPPPENEAASDATRCERKRTRTDELIRAYGGKRGFVHPSLTAFLHAYGRVAYTPGPFLAAGLVVALLAAFGIAGARGASLRLGALLFSTTALFMLVGSVAVTVFSWRYQLPQLVLVPPAAALGLSALARRSSARESARTTVRERL